MSAPTRDKALARRLERQATEGVPVSGRFGPSTTVAELAAWWLDHVAAHRVRPTSLHRYRARVGRFTTVLGSVPVVDLRAEEVAAWQSALLSSGLAAGTVDDARVVLGQVLTLGVDYGLVVVNVVDRVGRPTVTRRKGRALAPEEVRRLVAAARDERLGAAIAVLFVGGWRVSEALGLCWGDVDLDAGTAMVRRAAVHLDGVGAVFGPPKTAGVIGEHHLSPVVVAMLRARRKVQIAERLVAGPLWESHEHDGADVEPIFTTLHGRLVLRQTLTTIITRVAIAAGLDPKGIATHTGRRSVVTALYAAGGLDLGDIARHVGHASPATTAGYVRDLGERPRRTADVAAELLDPYSPVE